jgi:Membrane proteins related to metalloendopeptidases
MRNILTLIGLLSTLAFSAAPGPVALNSALDLLPGGPSSGAVNVNIGEFVGYFQGDGAPVGLPVVGAPSRPDLLAAPEVTCLFHDPDYPTHAGVDVAIRNDQPIYSTMDGVVVFAGWSDVFGWLVIVENNDQQTYYAHNSVILVSPGDLVMGRQMIALGGSTGNSTGPHSHYAVSEKQSSVIDPLTSVSPDSYLRVSCLSKG